MISHKPFWKTKSLDEMSEAEWESLCDGCGQCCLVKLREEESEELHTTSLSCKLLNTKSARCIDYHNRIRKVPTCLVLNPLTENKLALLPDTCAYKLLSQGKTLYDWHPLISGNQQSVIQAGISVAGKVIPEQYVHPSEQHQFIVE